MGWTRRHTATVLALAALVAGGTVLLFPAWPGPAGHPGQTSTETVSLGGSNVTAWPYLTPSPSFVNPTISVNVVVMADGDRVQRYLLQESGFHWNQTAKHLAERQDIEEAGADEPRVAWTDSPGGKRYLYVARGPTLRDAHWLPQTFQVNHGDYFGSQLHVRAYEPYDDKVNVTVLQAHTEHFDWFTITHTVDGIQRARRAVERDFRGQRFVDGIRRVYWGNGDTFDADGWATVVRALGGLLLLGRLSERTAREALAELRRPRNRRRLTLFAGLAALFLSVRAGGILFERHLALGPDTIVRTWYPVLVGGVPLAAYAGGRRLDPTDAFVAASLGLGAGIVLDYAYLGVAVLPIEIMVHRVNVCVAAGLIAAGARPADSEPWNEQVLAGAVLWAVMIVFPHVV